MFYSTVLLAIFVNFSFAADISILTDTSLVETGEVNNVKAVIDQPFDEISKFNSGDFCNIVTDKKIIIIPELTNLNDLLAKRNFGAACSPHDISLAKKINSDDITCLNNFVNNGGNIIVLGSNRQFQNNDVKFLNSAFDMSLSHFGNGIVCEQSVSKANLLQSANTPFANLPSTITGASATYCLASETVPENACHIYQVGEETWAFI